MQAFQTIIYATIPIALMMILMPIVFQKMDYPMPFCQELWNYNIFALAGMVFSGMIDL